VLAGLLLLLFATITIVTIGVVPVTVAVWIVTVTVTVRWTLVNGCRTLGIRVLFREEIAPGAFSDSLGEDIRALMNHNTGIVLGRTRANTLRLFEDATGLGFELDLPETTAGRDLAESIRRGDITQMSFGFETLSDEWRMEDKAEIRTLKKIRLFEISPVAFPAYPQTEVALRSLEAWRSESQDEATPDPEPAAEANEPPLNDNAWRTHARARDLALKSLD
jgi:HK97 family phage prohead protease